MKLDVKPIEHPSFIAGRAAGLYRGDEWIGTMGEVHPRGIERCGLRHPIAVLELNLAQLLQERSRGT